MNGVVLLRVDRVTVGNGHPRHLHPALDLKILQAGLEAAGTPVTLVDGWLLAGGPDAWLRQALRGGPRVAVIKGETWCLPEAIECARRLRQAGVVTIAIGQQVSHAMRAAEAGWREAFDLALAGEVEEELLRLLPRLLDDDSDLLRNDCWRLFARGHHHAVEAADGLPRAVFSATEMRAFAFPFPLPGRPLRRWAYVLGARGCPHRCRHCSSVVRKSFGDRLRWRDPVRVADEVAAHLAAGAEAIAFEDDTFFVDRRQFLALCDEMVRRRIVAPWIANARPDELDEERVAAAGAAGARLLKVGIETVTPRLVEMMGKSRHGANWRTQTEAGLARLKRHRIASVGLFLVGLPTQTRAEIADTLAWARDLAPDYVQVQIFRSYPDIPWWDELPATMRDAAAAWHYGPISSTTAALPANALPAMQREFYRDYYLRPGFALNHLARCWRHYFAPAGLAATLDRLRYMLRGSPPALQTAGGATSRGD